MYSWESVSSLQGEEKGEKRTFMKTCEMPTFKGCTEQMELTQASERKQPGTQGQKKMSTWHQEMQEQKQFHEGLSSPQGKTCREVKKIKGQKPSVTCSRKSLRQERHGHVCWEPGCGSERENNTDDGRVEVRDVMVGWEMSGFHLWSWMRWRQGRWRVLITGGTWCDLSFNWITLDSVWRKKLDRKVGVWEYEEQKQENAIIQVRGDGLDGTRRCNRDDTQWIYSINILRNSLAVQQLGLHASIEGGMCSIPHWGSKMLQAKPSGGVKNKREKRNILKVANQII